MLFFKCSIILFGASDLLPAGTRWFVANRLVIHSLVSERSIKVSSTERINGNSFSVPRDCTGTEQPCSAWWWAPTSAHNCHAGTHSFWGMECHQGITWWAHHSHHQEEEEQLWYQQVIQNFVRGGIRLLPILKQRILLLPGTWLAQQIFRKHPWGVHWILLPVTEKAAWD